MENKQYKNFLFLGACVLYVGCASPVQKASKAPAPIVSYSTFNGKSTKDGGIAPWVLGSKETELGLSICKKNGDTYESSGHNVSVYKCMVAVAEPGMPERSAVFLTYLDGLLHEIKLELTSPPTNKVAWNRQASLCWEVYRRGVPNLVDAKVDAPSGVYDGGMFNMDKAWLLLDKNSEKMPTLRYHYPATALKEQYIEVSQGGCVLHVQSRQAVYSDFIITPKDITSQGIGPFTAELDESKLESGACKKQIGRSSWECKAILEGILPTKTNSTLFPSFKEGKLTAVWFSLPKPPTIGDFARYAEPAVLFTKKMCSGEKIVIQDPTGQVVAVEPNVDSLAQFFLVPLLFSGKPAKNSVAYVRLGCPNKKYVLTLGPSTIYFSVESDTNLRIPPASMSQSNEPAITMAGKIESPKNLPLSNYKGFVALDFGINQATLVKRISSGKKSMCRTSRDKTVVSCKPVSLLSRKFDVKFKFKDNALTFVEGTIFSSKKTWQKDVSSLANWMSDANLKVASLSDLVKTFKDQTQKLDDTNLKQGTDLKFDLPHAHLTVLETGGKKAPRYKITFSLDR